MAYVTPTDFTPGMVVTDAHLDNLSDNISSGLWRPLGEVVLSAAAASMDISGIPATFRSLAIEISGRGSAVVAAVGITLRFNNDSTPGAYSFQNLVSSGTSPAAGEQLPAANATSGSVGVLPASTASASLAGSCMIYIADYTNTSYHKVAHSTGGYRTGATTGLMSTTQHAMFWTPATIVAINRVTALISSGNFEAVSRMTLWGMPR